MKLKIKFPKEHKGGAGSGHHGHAGRPGQRGGSAAGSGGKPTINRNNRANEYDFDYMHSAAAYIKDKVKRNAISAGSLDLSSSAFDKIVMSVINEFDLSADEITFVEEGVISDLMDELVEMPGFS